MPSWGENPCILVVRGGLRRRARQNPVVVVAAGFLLRGFCREVRVVDVYDWLAENVCDAFIAGLGWFGVWVVFNAATVPGGFGLVFPGPLVFRVG